MKISYLHIKNFKSIRDLEIKDMDKALILVGKNNTGKTTCSPVLFYVRIYYLFLLFQNELISSNVLPFVSGTIFRTKIADRIENAP